VSSVVTGENLRQGFLQKLSTGAIKRWQKRYFVVAGHYLNYTDDEDHAQEHDAIKASIDLFNVTEYTASDNKITLAVGTEKHQFKAEDQADAAEWLNVMRGITADYRDALRKKALEQYQMAAPREVPRFKHLDESVQRQLDEARLMSNNIRPGEGDRWIYNAKSLQHHISNSMEHKKAKDFKRMQEEDKNKPQIDSDWAVAIKASLAEPKTNTEVSFNLSHSPELI
jgi:hypothetical protein